MASNDCGMSSTMTLLNLKGGDLDLPPTMLRLYSMETLAYCSEYCPGAWGVGSLRDSQGLVPRSHPPTQFRL